MKIRNAPSSFQRRLVARAAGAVLAGAIGVAVMAALLLFLAACRGGDSGDPAVGQAVSGAAAFSA
ncbi:hypothetical protein [Piscinibacter sp. XHJ-5]|uniref:hypothetical protein n=1 Tax=Piscinibacter sp. XHJ-5 TaxID=3037797 RepID=UPI002452AD13|nr:hypothetical protein [Piscinibacter sp. XHJ-5]